MSELGRLDALILAGGLGTRLRAALPDRPKALAPVAGRPFLFHLLDHLAHQGIRRAVLALGHQAAMIREAVADYRALDLAISEESRPLDTGGALALARPLLGSDPVLVLNGDSLAPIDLGLLLQTHRSRHAQATLAALRLADAARFGSLDLDADGAILAFREKGKAGPGLVSAGIYLVSRAVLESLAPDQPLSLERAVFPGLCGRGLYAQAFDAPLLDIGTPESYATAEAFLSRHSPPAIPDRSE
ncbi:MAG: NTP transferase domain-containing protein [Rhodospirillales bacterium]|nr:NTP transferase domain-containing protein [Rhodospirillales bacterium]